MPQHLQAESEQLAAGGENIDSPAGAEGNEKYQATGPNHPLGKKYIGLLRYQKVMTNGMAVVTNHATLAARLVNAAREVASLESAHVASTRGKEWQKQHNRAALIVSSCATCLSSCRLSRAHCANSSARDVSQGGGTDESEAYLART